MAACVNYSACVHHLEIVNRRPNMLIARSPERVHRTLPADDTLLAVLCFYVIPVRRMISIVSLLCFHLWERLHLAFRRFNGLQCNLNLRISRDANSIALVSWFTNDHRWRIRGDLKMAGRIRPRFIRSWLNSRRGHHDHLPDVIHPRISDRFTGRVCYSPGYGRRTG